MIKLKKLILMTAFVVSSGIIAGCGFGTESKTQKVLAPPSNISAAESDDTAVISDKNAYDIKSDSNKEMSVYKNIIDKYRQKDQSSDSAATSGYFITDLDGDGVKELILKYMENDSDSGARVAVYTISDNKPLELKNPQKSLDTAATVSRINTFYSCNDGMGIAAEYKTGNSSKINRIYIKDKKISTELLKETKNGEVTNSAKASSIGASLKMIPFSETSSGKTNVSETSGSEKKLNSAARKNITYSQQTFNEASFELPSVFTKTSKAEDCDFGTLNYSDKITGASFSVYYHNYTRMKTEASADKLMKQRLENIEKSGDTVKYKTKSKNSYAVCWQDGTDIVVEYTEVSSSEKKNISFSFKYPVEEKQFYSPLIKHVYENFICSF